MRALFALFIRSLREDTRAKLPPILRAAMVAIVLLILWEAQSDFAYRTASGRNLLASVMLLNAAFLAIAAVSIFPSAITEEKEDETLPLLRMTNLSPVSILLGKGAPRLLGAIFLLLVQIPFSLLAVTLGGVTLSQVLGSYAILGATAVFLCGLALLASVYCRTALRAGFLTGIVGAIFYVGLPLLGIVTSLRRMRFGNLSSGTAGETFFMWVMESNPVYGIMVMLHQSADRPVMPAVWVNLIGGAVFFGFAWLLFDRYCTQVGEGAPRPRKAAGAGVPRRWFGVPRTWRLPLVWKDFHFMVGGRKGLVFRTLFAAVSFFCAYAFVMWIDPPYSSRGLASPSDSPRFWRQVGEISMALAGCYLALDLLLITSRVFGDERRRLTLSSLVSLPWTVWRIVWQKVVGCMPAFLPWVALFAAGVLANWREVESEFRSLHFDEVEITWMAIREGLGILLYAASQGILLLLVVVWFSLRIRRGALPAGIATMAVWNILFAFIVDEANRNNEVDLVYTGLFLSVPMIFIMCRAIVRRIQLAAAAD